MSINSRTQFVAGFLMILDGLARVITLGYWKPLLCYQFSIYCLHKDNEKYGHHLFGELSEGHQPEKDNGS